MHLPELVRDLAIILGLAGFVGILFRRLKQPVVLGYIVVGMLAGPHVPWIPTVADLPNIQVLAELGIVFLLFSLGLEFTFTELLKRGLSSFVIALIEVASMGALGYFVGKMVGWSTSDALFLGGILSISSTTIIIKAIDELNLKARKFTQTVFGVLIMEDLVAILLLIALSTIALSRGAEGKELLLSLGKLVLILPLWIGGGMIVVPRILRLVKPWLNSEALLIFSLGVCLAFVLFSNAMGYSAALGAFIAGAILAGSSERKKIEELVMPIRNLFGAIFFVSVGMLFDPAVLKEHGVVILVITLVTIVGKALSTTLGALLAGQGLKPSVQTGFSLAQIGEFSFIIASLGATLQVTSSFLYPIAVAVALVTSFTTPYLIRFSEPVANWLERNLPKSFLDRLYSYESALRKSDKLLSEKGLLPKMKAYFNVLHNALVAGPSPYRDLAPWSAHLSALTLEPHSELAGKTLRALNVRGRTGVNVVVVERGGQVIVSPSPDQTLLPLDQVIVLGTDEQLQLLRPLVESGEVNDNKIDTKEYQVDEFIVHPDSFLVGRSIREAGIREKYEGLVVGLERKGKRTMNPDSDLSIESGDILWVVIRKAFKGEMERMATQA